MINSDLIRLLILISLPFLIEKGRDFMRHRALNLQKPKRNKTRLDYFIISLLTSNSILQIIFAIWLKPPNIFKDTGVPLRISTNILIKNLAENNKTFGDNEKILLKKFESYENRLIYATYGEKALLDCSYCSSLTDYLIFIIPNIAWSYVIMSIILGVATTLKRKAHWRTYGVIWLLGSGFLELYMFITVDFSNLDSGGNIGFLYCTIDFYRKLSFSVLCLAILFFDKIDERNNLEILTDVSRKLESIIYRSRALNIQRTSVLKDSNLRRLFIEYYKRVEMDDNTVSSDPEYKEVREKALSKLNVEKLMKDAECYVEDINTLKESETDSDLAVGIQSTSSMSSTASSFLHIKKMQGN
ncbi:13656_t:CDS:1 [Funneliformis geosporum]|uniref:11410_t:CDS:1 n=1 Tax=Funneliformis geosporum TaxID=1117311 RepID=A0A9W4SJ63_9GLOM|nr:11410_t:CDS:1 [Funneliformis geosporum]CAI2187494.1 13656_t:CDS:1 [Funneliformis geosporum]